MRMFKKNRKGFTLIELIIVMAVLLILAGIAVPVASNITANAKGKADNATIATYKSAIEWSAADTGAYPADALAATAAIKSFTGVSSVPAPQVGDSGFAFLYNTTTHEITKGKPGTDTNPYAISAARP